MSSKNHYVYLLSSKVGEKYYIGVRSCTCPISEDTYMGSSKVMTKEDKLACNKIILKRFNDRDSAVKYEIELHNKFDVVNNPLFWNAAKQTSTGFDTTGRIIPKEEREKRSKALMGHKGASTWLGKKLPESTRLKISKSNKGKPKSESHKQALKNAHKYRVYTGYDNTMYTFTHKDYGTVKCTQYQLYTTYLNIHKSNLNKLIKKEYKSTAGWSLYE